MKHLQLFENIKKYSLWFITESDNSSEAEYKKIKKEVARIRGLIKNSYEKEEQALSYHFYFVTNIPEEQINEVIEFITENLDGDIAEYALFYFGDKDGIITESISEIKTIIEKTEKHYKKQRKLYGEIEDYFYRTILGNPRTKAEQTEREEKEFEKLRKKYKFFNSDNFNELKKAFEKGGKNIPKFTFTSYELKIWVIVDDFKNDPNNRGVISSVDSGII